MPEFFLFFAFMFLVLPFAISIYALKEVRKLDSRTEEAFSVTEKGLNQINNEMKRERMVRIGRMINK